MVLLSRRLFIGGAIAAPVAAAAEIQSLAHRSHFPQMPTGFVGVTPCGSFNSPRVIPSSGRIALADEPGQPLEIRGTVYHPGRLKPAAGVVIFAYHTDAHGYYNHPNSPFNPRIHGWVKTDSEGRYSFRTIKPAPYPDNSSPAHIHVTLSGAEYPEYWVDAYWFEGDPLITPKQRSLLTGRGGGGETVHLVRDSDGVLRGRRDFVLQHVAVAGDCHFV